MIEHMEHTHDMSMVLSPEELKMILKDAELVVEDAIKHKDPEIALEYGARLNRMGQAAWATCAHLVYKLNEVWGTDALPAEGSFLDAVGARWNKSRETVRRYLEIWTYVIEKPEHKQSRVKRLVGKSMQGLWYIKAAAKEGQLTESDWEEIEDAPDMASLRDISKRVRGEYGRAKDALKLQIDPEDGTIRARTKGAYEVVGVLNIKSGSEVVQAAVEAITGRAGMFWK